MQKIVFYIMAAAMICSGSCAKRKSGCTDSASTNYCSDCKDDDGSCQYQGKMVVWWDKSVSDSVRHESFTVINVYINNFFIARYSDTLYWTGAPTCGDVGSITIPEGLGGFKSKSFIVALKDDDDGIISTKTATVNANQCQQVQMPWH